MKIAVNTRLLIPDKIDGIGRFTLETLRIITKKHPEVQFTLLFDRKMELDVFGFPKNVKAVFFGPPARHPLLWYIWFEYKLKHYLNKHHFDLFLSPEGWLPPSINCKSLAVIHDLNFEHYPENIIWSHRKYLQNFFPKFVKRADRIATVSNYTKQDIIKTYQVTQEYIDVVYNGANAVFKPISPEEKAIVKENYTDGKDFFIFVGSLHPRKNLEHLFLAFDAFKKQSGSTTKLLIAGNKKWWPKKLDRLYHRMKFKEEVIFVGRLADEELAKLLASASALTYLPYFEGFGIPILEAFNCEVPVITSKVTSMPEVAKDAAILCDPKNVQEIAAAMERVSTVENLRADLIKKGKVRALDFSWEKTAELLWESMEKTLE